MNLRGERESLHKFMILLYTYIHFPICSCLIYCSAFLWSRSNELLFSLKIDIFMTGKILLARKFQAISSAKQQPDNFILAEVTTHLNL